MPNYVRPKVTGATVFFTVNLADRSSSLLTDRIDDLREAVRVTRADRPFGIDAWVVLPDHMHCVWSMPAGDGDYATRWGAIKSRFTRSIRNAGRVGFQPTVAKRLGHSVGWNPTLRKSASKVRKGDAGIWQRRFWEHHIRDEDDYRAHVEYCWVNPVKHGYVNEPDEWPYSYAVGRGLPRRGARFEPGMAG
ncbi:MAG: transposase [Pseudomonadota bacterium]